MRILDCLEVVLRYELCDEFGREILEPGLDDGDGVSAERAGLLADRVFLPLIVLRCLLGAFEAACKIVDIRCIRGGSGDLTRSEVCDEVCEDVLRGTMKP